MPCTDTSLSEAAKSFKTDFDKARGFRNSLWPWNWWTWNVSLQCAYASEMAALLDHNEVYIKKLSTTFHFFGHGGRTMDWLTDLADKHGVTLVLHSDPEDDEPLDYEQLMSFYERRGFICVDGHGLMKRQPVMANNHV